MKGTLMMRGLDQLANPKSIAIVDASVNPTRIGGRPLHYVLTMGYQGEIDAENSRSDQAQDLKSHSSLNDISGELDFALSADPAPAVVQTVQVAIAKCAPTKLMSSSGFAEVDEAGIRARQEIVTMAHVAGVRVLGPNCLGIINPANNFYPTVTWPSRIAIRCPANSGSPPSPAATQATSIMSARRGVWGSGKSSAPGMKVTSIGTKLLA